MQTPNILSDRTRICLHATRFTRFDGLACVSIFALQTQTRHRATFVIRHKDKSQLQQWPPTEALRSLDLVVSWFAVCCWKSLDCMVSISLTPLQSPLLFIIVQNATSGSTIENLIPTDNIYLLSVAGLKPTTPRQAIQHNTDKTYTHYLRLWLFKAEYYVTFEKEMTDENITG